MPNAPAFGSTRFRSRRTRKCPGTTTTMSRTRSTCSGERSASSCATPRRKFASGPANFLLGVARSEEHTSELQSQSNLVCRLLLEKKKKNPVRFLTCLHLNTYPHSYCTHD